MTQSDGRKRCAWIANDDLMRVYHDEEWGVPVHEDGKWFEFIVLDAFQAGLSWRTVLHKREAFREVFHCFDPERVARMTAREKEDMMRSAAKEWLKWLPGRLGRLLNGLITTGISYLF